MAGAPQGNLNAVRAKRVREAIMRAIGRAGGTIDAGLDKACDRLVKMLNDVSDVDDFKWAFETIANRLDGKPAQALQVTGEDGGPLKIQRIDIKAVDP